MILVILKLVLSFVFLAWFLCAFVCEYVFLYVRYFRLSFSSLSICFMIDLNARQLSDQSWDKWLRLDITLRTLHLRIKKTHVRMRILYCRFNIDDCDVSLKAARV